jgi:hypothetical protein
MLSFFCKLVHLKDIILLLNLDISRRKTYRRRSGYWCLSILYGLSLSCIMFTLLVNTHFVYIVENATIDD